MKINKKITKINKKQCKSRSIKYIVVHYVGATGDAKANCNYFYDTYRGASAHYFVGHKGDIWQCVDDKDIAWHCGAKKYYHDTCRNSNSIGVEMCCKKKDGKWYFEEKTVDSTVELVKYLMEKYNVPESRVIRHYDVTHKSCPEPYVKDSKAWKSFKARLTVYKVKVTAKELNIRKEASASSDIVGVLTKNDKVKITITKMNGSTLWGKCSKGWISLKYTEKVS